MEPQRSNRGDSEQHWFDGGEWSPGRHGALSPDASYRGAGEEYTGAFNVGESAPVSGPAGHGEPSRRSAEPIDVDALRRPPASAPPAGYPLPPVAYGGPQAQPLYPPGPGQGGSGPAGHGTATNPLSAPTAAVHTVAPTRQPSPSVYHSRKPAVLIVLAVLTVLFEIPALRLLTSATVEDVVPVAGVVAGTFMVVGIPVFAYGLYALLRGGPVTTNPATWLKPPLIYLPLGVLLFLFAALAS